MRNSGMWWIIALVMLLLDFYVYQALKTVTQNSSDKARMVIHLSYWVVSGMTLLLMMSFPYIQALQTSKIFRNYIFAIFLGLFFAKLIAAIFFLTDDVRRGSVFMLSKVLPTTGAQFMSEGNAIPRSMFLSWLGLGVGSTLFGT